MKIMKNELRVYYNLDEGINRKLDDAIRKAIKETTNLKFYASGIEIKTGIRDMAFDRINNKEKT